MSYEVQHYTLFYGFFNAVPVKGICQLIISSFLSYDIPLRWP